MPVVTPHPTSTPIVNVGRYEVVCPLSSGGMATVYLARRRGVGGFEKEVALKLTHAHLKEDPVWADELIEEAKLAARVRHTNVVQVLDVETDASGVFLVMEYVEGASLSQLLRGLGDELEMRIALRVLGDMLAGLHAAHEVRGDRGELLHLVHRDVSPQNVLIGADGATRLIDFGVAKASSRRGWTRSGIVKGKVAYMSPEQVRGRPLDRRADVWAAGVLAWELFAGRRLYASSNEAEAVLRIVSQPPPRLRSVVPDIPAAIDEAVARALALHCDARLSTAAELRTLLLEAGDMADLDEVSALVHRVAGDAIAHRRALLQVPASDVHAVTSTLRLAPPATVVDLPFEAGAASGMRRVRPRALVWAAATAAAVIGLTALGAGGLALGRNAPERHHEEVEPALPGALAMAAPPAVAPPEPPEPPRAVEPSPAPKAEARARTRRRATPPPARTAATAAHATPKAPPLQPMPYDHD